MFTSSDFDECDEFDDDEDYCPECGAGLDEECDVDCSYYEDDEDEDE